MMMIEKINGNTNPHDEGDCGDYIRTLSAMDSAIVAHGVVAYDGELVHIIGSLDGQYFDGRGFRDVDDIRTEWAYDRSADDVQIVDVELVDSAYVYDGQSISAEIIEL